MLFVRAIAIEMAALGSVFIGALALRRLLVHASGPVCLLISSTVVALTMTVLVLWSKQRRKRRASGAFR
jgi:hypothetical protein